MPEILCLRIDWNHTAIPLRIASRFFTLEFGPEPEYPFGRKGLGLTRSWEQLAKDSIDGMLLLDGDVAIDPYDFEMMLKSIDAYPSDVHTTTVKLWPVSTKYDTWVWGHGRDEFYTQRDYSDKLDMFTFCFTYLPRRLIEYCIESGLAQWQFPLVDKNVCTHAKKLGVPIRIVRAASPKHLNY